MTMYYRQYIPASIRKCRSCKCAKRDKPRVAIARGCKGRCGRLADGMVTPLPAPPLSDPNRTPRTYILARVSGKHGKSEDDNRSDTLHCYSMQKKRTDCGRLSSSNGFSYGFRTYTGQYCLDESLSESSTAYQTVVAGQLFLYG